MDNDPAPSDWEAWPSLRDISAVDPLPGLIEGRERVLDRDVGRKIRRHFWDSNAFLVIRAHTVSAPEGWPAFGTTDLFDHAAMLPRAEAFPFFLWHDGIEAEELEDRLEDADWGSEMGFRQALSNLSQRAWAYLAAMRAQGEQVWGCYYWGQKVPNTFWGAES